VQDVRRKDQRRKANGFAVLRTKMQGKSKYKSKEKEMRRKAVAGIRKSEWVAGKGSGENGTPGVERHGMGGKARGRRRNDSIGGVQGRAKNEPRAIAANAEEKRSGGDDRKRERSEMVADR